MNELKSKILKLNQGMSYIELIVVLSIFSVMTSVLIFNYGDFQIKIDLKNLASDIALKAVQAQKSSLSGLFPPFPQQSLVTITWKPSYGLYFNLATDNKSFLYFVDINNNNTFDGTVCTDECLDKILITKGNSISRIDLFYQGDATPHPFNDLTVSFVRPSSNAVFRSTSTIASTVSYAQITVVPSRSNSVSLIKIYSSGRIQIN
jgi:type II secretory pathway pseudopilin PulG